MTLGIGLGLPQSAILPLSISAASFLFGGVSQDGDAVALAMSLQEDQCSEVLLHPAGTEPGIADFEAPPPGMHALGETTFTTSEAVVLAMPDGLNDFFALSILVEGEVRTTGSFAVDTGGSIFLTQGGITLEVAGAASVHDWANGTQGVTTNGTITVRSVSPAAATVTLDGAPYAVNGAMVDLQAGEQQAFHAAPSDYDGARAATFPVTLSPGQTLNVARHEPSVAGDGGQWHRNGVNAEYALVAVYATGAAPSGNLAPAGAGWAGRAALADETLDLAAARTALRSRQIASGLTVDFDIDAELDIVGRYFPIWSWTTGTTGGYQAMLPHDYGAGSVTTNYGVPLSRRFDAILAAMMDAGAMTDAQLDRAILILASMGKQVWEVGKFGGLVAEENGAHRGLMEMTAAFYLFATGRSADYPDLRAFAGGALWNGQMGLVTAQMAADAQGPHTDPAKVTLGRALLTVSRIVASDDNGAGPFLILNHDTANGYADRPDYKGLRITKQDKSLSTTITDGYGVFAVSGDPAVHGGNAIFGDGPVEIAYPVLDATGFAPGDTVMLTRIPAIQEGDVFWTTRIDTKFPETFFAAGQDYRSVVSYGMDILFLAWLGIDTPDAIPLYRWLRLVEDGQPATQPEYPNQYAPLSRLIQGSGFHVDFYTDHLPQIVDSALSADTAVPDGPAADRRIYDSGAARGEDAAFVPVTGATDAADGATIQARVVMDDGQETEHVGWTTVGTANGGAFDSAIFVPRAPAWLYLETRVGEGGAATRSARRFASGHVWAVGEQSNGSRLLAQMANGAASALYDPLTHPGDVQIVARETEDGGTYRIVPVTEANKGADGVSPTIVSMANAFSAARPGEKLALVWNAKAGTHPFAELTTAAEDGAGGWAADAYSASNARDWDVDAAIVAAAQGDGARIGARFVPGWWEANSLNADLALLHYRLQTGLEADGSAVVLGGGAGEIDLPRLHPTTRGGALDTAVTRFGFFGPHGNQRRIGQSNLPQAATITGPADLPGHALPNDADYNNLRVNAAGLYDGTGLTTAYSGDTFGGYLTTGDEVHFVGGDRDGRQWLGLTWMWHMMHQTGLHPYGMPALTDRYDEPTGLWVDFWIAGNATLTTERLRRSDAAGGGAFDSVQSDGTAVSIPRAIPQIGATGGNADPATGANTPHRTEVMGWSINDRPAERVAIHTVTAQEVADGHAAPAGQVVCRVHAQSGGPLAATDSILYLTGIEPYVQVEEDLDDRSYLNMLSVDLGQPAAMRPAVPVQGQGAAGLATTRPVADFFKVTDTWYRHVANTAAASGLTGAVMEFRGRFDSLPGANYRNIMGIAGSQLRLQNTGAGGQVFLRINASGTTIETPFAADATTFYHIRATMDYQTGQIELYDVAAGTVLASATDAGAVGSGSGRVEFCAASGGSQYPIDGTFEMMRIWTDQLDTSGPPAFYLDAAAATPFFELGQTAAELELRAGHAAPVQGFP